MDENKQMTTGGRIFVWVLVIMGLTLTLLGSAGLLFPSPNPVDFMTRLYYLVFAVGGGVTTSLALMVLRLKGRK